MSHTTTHLTVAIDPNTIIAYIDPAGSIRLTRQGFRVLHASLPDTPATLTSKTIGDFLTFAERSTDPDDPEEGQFLIWMSDGTGAGDDGDVMVKLSAGGVTKTATLLDFSAL